MDKVLLLTFATIGAVVVLPFLFFGFLYFAIRFIIFLFPFILLLLAFFLIYGIYGVGKILFWKKQP